MAFNDTEPDHSVTLFRATDPSPIMNLQLPTGSVPLGARSDGVSFRATLRGSK